MRNNENDRQAGIPSEGGVGREGGAAASVGDNTCMLYSGAPLALSLPSQECLYIIQGKGKTPWEETHFQEDRRWEEEKTEGKSSLRACLLLPRYKLL